MLKIKLIKTNVSAEVEEPQADTMELPKRTYKTQSNKTQEISTRNQKKSTITN